MLNYWESWRKIPLIRMLLVTGLYTWITIALVGFSGRKRCFKMLCGLLPAFVLFVGLFMSHVNGMLRYGYPLIAVGPLLLAWAVHAVHEPEMRTEPELASSQQKDKASHTPADSLFVHAVNVCQTKGIRRLLRAGDTVTSLFTSRRDAEQASAQRRRILQLKAYTAATPELKELEERICFFLELWQDPAAVSQHYRMVGLRTGTELL